MTNADLTIRRGILLALRARLQGDVTQMADNALNKDHSKTTSMPTSMAELGSENFDQELTLSLMGNDKDALNQIEVAIAADRRRQLWPVRGVRRQDSQIPPGCHSVCGTVCPLCFAAGVTRA